MDYLVMAGDTPAEEVDWSRLGHVYLVANGKGGVGKTTTVSHLAALAALSGLRVLVVDLNGQGNIGEDLGYTGDKERDDEGQGLFRAVILGEALRPVEVRPRLDVVPGGEWVARIVAAMGPEMADPERARTMLLALARALEKVADDYDLIVIDSPPEVAVLMQLALCAARWIVVPMKTDESSRKGLRGVGRHFRAMRSHNPFVVLLGVFVFASGTGSTRIRGHLRGEVERDLGGADLLFNAFIRHSEGVGRDVRFRGEPVFELERRIGENPAFWELRAGTADRTRLVSGTAAGVAEDYAALVKEIFARAQSVQRRMAAEGSWP